MLLCPSHTKLTNNFTFSFAGTSGNIFRDIKRYKSPRGGIHLAYGGNRFVQYMYRDQVGHYRCIKFRAKCYVKLRVDEQMKYAQEKGTHNHDKTMTHMPHHREVTESSTLKPKASNANSGSTSSDEFVRDVTADVELITNDRNVTLMFLKGFKFTKYFENKTHNRYEHPL